MFMLTAALFIKAKNWKQSKFQSISGMDKQNVIYPYSRILISNEKELSIDTCYNMNEPQKHYAKRKEPDTKTIHRMIIFI